MKNIPSKGRLYKVKDVRYISVIKDDVLARTTFIDIFTMT